MTVSDVASPAPRPGLRVSTPGLVDRQRRRRAFHAARRHSRWVGRLRFLLPLSGGLALLGLIGLTRLAMPDSVDLAAAGLSVSKNSVVMQRPHLSGFDAAHRGYSVSADRAIQTLSDPNKVRLEVIRATVGEDAGSATQIKAEAGDYDSSASTLQLHGGIEVDSPQGISIRMRDAAVDFNAGTMNSPHAVTVQYQGGETTGQSISVTDNGKIIVLDGGVRTTITPKAGEGEPALVTEE